MKRLKGSFAIAAVVVGVLVVLCVCAVNLRQVSAQSGVFSDNFEDNSIDASLWTVGGTKTGFPPSDWGNWSWSQDETVYDPGDPDGYLRLHVTGPYTENSYGAVSWIRTNYNFNDGNSHILNFTWKPQSADTHWNGFRVQMTNGYVPPGPSGAWTSQEMTGAHDLLWYQQDGVTWHPYGHLDSQSDNPLQSAKETWSVTISPSGLVSLFDQNGLRSHGQATLDPAEPWYFRLLAIDATSAGFGAGDSQLNMYSFSATVPEPSTFALLGVGAISLLAYAWRRRMRTG